jgi:hypothetical protein
MICVSRPKSASFSFKSEFSGRGAAEAQEGNDKRHFFAEVHITFFRRPHKAKGIIGKITNCKFILEESILCQRITLS